MTERWLRALVVVAAVCCRVTPIAAQGRDVDVILQQVERQQEATSVEYVGEITVTSRSGAERHRTWISFRQGSGKTANRLIRFLSPAELRGVSFLSLGRPGRSADQWMYLPSMKRERRLAPQDRETPFAGTDFSYGDLEEFDRSDFTASLESDQTLDGDPCYVVRLTPRHRSSVAYELMAISQSRFIPRQVTFFRRDRSAPEKTLSFADYRQFDRHWIAQRIEMADAAKGSRTVVRLTDVKVDRPQPSDRFTVQNLTREGADLSDAFPSQAAVAAQSASLSSGSGSIQSDDGTRLAPWAGMSGAVEARVLLYPNGRSGVDPPALGLGRFDLRQQVGHDRVRAVAAVRAEAASGDQLGPVRWDPADRLPRRSPLSITELAVSATLAPALDASIGRFGVGWGSTDLRSAASGFLPRDFTDPLSAEDLPLWGARVSGERGLFRLEAYHAFTTTPWRLPRTDGRYSPGAPEDVYLLDAAQPPPARGFDMVRVTGRGPGWDLTGWVRAGTDPAPILTVDLDHAQTVPDGRVAVMDRRYASERAAGLELNYPVGGWVVRGEASVTHSPDRDLGTAYFLTVQAEHTYRAGLLTLAYAGAVTNTLPTLTFAIDRAVLPSVTLAFAQSESWADWEASWVATTDTVGGILNGSVTRPLAGPWRLTIGFDTPHGASTSALGAFSLARRVRAALKYAW